MLLTAIVRRGCVGSVPGRRLIRLSVLLGIVFIAFVMPRVHAQPTANQRLSQFRRVGIFGPQTYVAQHDSGLTIVVLNRPPQLSNPNQSHDDEDPNSDFDDGDLGSDDTFSLRLVINSGMQDEPANAPEVAHLAEHLALLSVPWHALADAVTSDEGQPRRPRRREASFFNGLERFQIDGKNATTGTDRTEFTFSGVPLSLLPVFTLAAGHIVSENNLPSRALFLRELRAVQAEAFARRSDAAELADEQLVRLLGHESGHARFEGGRPALPSAISNLTQNDVENFMRGHYRPQNAVLVLEGLLSNTGDGDRGFHSLRASLEVALSHLAPASTSDPLPAGPSDAWLSMPRAPNEVTVYSVYPNRNRKRTRGGPVDSVVHPREELLAGSSPVLQLSWVVPTQDPDRVFGLSGLFQSLEGTGPHSFATWLVDRGFMDSGTRLQVQIGHMTSTHTIVLLTLPVNAAGLAQTDAILDGWYRYLRAFTHRRLSAVDRQWVGERSLELFFGMQKEIGNDLLGSVPFWQQVLSGSRRLQPWMDTARLEHAVNTNLQTALSGAARWLLERPLHVVRFGVSGAPTNPLDAFSNVERTTLSARTLGRGAPWMGVPTTTSLAIGAPDEHLPADEILHQDGGVRVYFRRRTGEETPLVKVAYELAQAKSAYAGHDRTKQNQFDAAVYVLLVAINANTELKSALRANEITLGALYFPETAKIEFRLSAHGQTASGGAPSSWAFAESLRAFMGVLQAYTGAASSVSAVDFNRWRTQASQQLTNLYSGMVPRLMDGFFRQVTYVVQHRDGQVRQGIPAPEWAVLPASQGIVTALNQMTLAEWQPIVSAPPHSDFGRAFNGAFDFRDLPRADEARLLSIVRTALDAPTLFAEPGHAVALDDTMAGRRRATAARLRERLMPGPTWFEPRPELTRDYYVVEAIPFTTPVERLLLMMLDQYFETDVGQALVNNHMRAGQTVLAYSYRVQASAQHPNYVFLQLVANSTVRHQLLTRAFQRIFVAALNALEATYLASPEEYYAWRQATFPSGGASNVSYRMVQQTLEMLRGRPYAPIRYIVGPDDQNTCDRLLAGVSLQNRLE